RQGRVRAGRQGARARRQRDARDPRPIPDREAHVTTNPRRPRAMSTTMTLRDSAVADYEDLVWKLAEGSGEPPDSREVSAACWAASHSLDELKRDVDLARSRAEQQPQMREALAASAKRADLTAERARQEDDFAVLRAKHDETVAALNSAIQAEDAK